jgi:hypothetical protein
MSTEYTDVVAWITSEATADDVARLEIVLQVRRKGLRTAQAAQARHGMAVVLDGLSPKYLNGLIGTIDGLNGRRCSVLLSPESTDRLRHTTQKRFYVSADMTRFLLRGVPTTCCLPA